MQVGHDACLGHRALLHQVSTLLRSELADEIAVLADVDLALDRPIIRAIDVAARRFEPEWTLPDGFSEWHYLVLDRTGHPDEYWYDRPVVVISDAGCFSATDIFLGALAMHPRVTLLGAASSGGSARSQRFRLSNSGIEVACASMASFRPDGRLYDGRGVEVDVEVPADPGDFLFGGGDRRLSAAMRLLDAD